MRHSAKTGCVRAAGRLCAGADRGRPCSPPCLPDRCILGKNEKSVLAKCFQSLWFPLNSDSVLDNTGMDAAAGTQRQTGSLRFPVPNAAFRKGQSRGHTAWPEPTASAPKSPAPLIPTSCRPRSPRAATEATVDRLVAPQGQRRRGGSPRGSASAGADPHPTAPLSGSETWASGASPVNGDNNTQFRGLF